MKDLSIYNDSDVGYMDEDFLELESEDKNKIIKDSEEECKEI